MGLRPSLAILSKRLSPVWAVCQRGQRDMAGSASASGQNDCVIGSGAPPVDDRVQLAGFVLIHTASCEALVPGFLVLFKDTWGPPHANSLTTATIIARPESWAADFSGSSVGTKVGGGR